jgi:hypothetical protein
VTTVWHSGLKKFTNGLFHAKNKHMLSSKKKVFRGDFVLVWAEEGKTFLLLSYNVE